MSLMWQSKRCSTALHAKSDFVPPAGISRLLTDPIEEDRLFMLGLTIMLHERSGASSL
jgi:hypothetical protein